MSTVICSRSSILTKYITNRLRLAQRRLLAGCSSVILSNSFDVFENLAIEDWLFTNFNHENDDKTLFIYRNQPCVVIGKFQNQWKECNLGYMAKNSIKLARRLSGGGTVYHDIGNVNLSMLSNRAEYDRQFNLQQVADVINKKWPHLKLAANERHDIISDQKFKVTGSAAKMMRHKAYHHFTLLIDVDKSNLVQTLASPVKDLISTNSSESVSSKTMNLSSTEHPIDVEDVVSYLTEQCSPMNNVKVVLPNEEHFPGITEIINVLRSWDWVYGKSPSFKITEKSFSDTHQVTVTVEKGLIMSVVSERIHDSSYMQDVSEFFHMHPFCPHTLAYHLSTIKNLDETVSQTLVKLFRKILFSF